MSGLQLVSNEYENNHSTDVSPLSCELVIGLVGFAGAGCSTATSRLEILLQLKDYQVEVVKLSSLIAKRYAVTDTPTTTHGIKAGQAKFERAENLQNLGDKLRQDYRHDAVASLAIDEIIARRGTHEPGKSKLAFILDSLKHPSEVELLRKVYDQSFRMIAVHCERPKREKRLIGSNQSSAKYSGVEEKNVQFYMDRDEKDLKRQNHGQQVRDAFYLADFFIDNNLGTSSGESMNEDLSRFVDLLLGSGIVRPTKSERAMYHAHAAALQSSCLSRQVGAALITSDGTIVSTGTNDVPKYGGGVYDEDSVPDHRCFSWKWKEGTDEFTGCHNQRKKMSLRTDISNWLSEQFSEQLALAAHPRPDSGSDTAERAREEATVRIRALFANSIDQMANLPGIKDIVEYSRSIHAEMNALLAAARNGTSPLGTTLYCTTYPCHNCARHLVTAGIERVYYIEPYVKSLARELHSDAIATEAPAMATTGSAVKQTHMIVVPFTGVGPRMYEDFFAKRTEVKNYDGSYQAPDRGFPLYAVRLHELRTVESLAAKLLDGGEHD